MADDGTLLTLGALGALAAGALVQRGSRAVDDDDLCGLCRMNKAMAERGRRTFHPCYACLEKERDAYRAAAEEGVVALQRTQERVRSLVAKATARGGSRAIPGPYARSGGLASFNVSPTARVQVPSRSRAKNPEIGLHFHGLSEKKLQHLFAAEAELLKAGISFDTGYGFQGDGVRDWEWDWSLKGPVTITVKSLGRKGTGSRTVASLALGEIAEVGIGLREADFWIPRKGTQKGEPTRTFGADHVGVRVTRTDVIVPGWLFYALQYLAMQGLWREQPVTVANVKAIRFQPTA